jgi:hypothetical protein
MPKAVRLKEKKITPYLEERFRSAFSGGRG